jgi:hypothetical protein
MLLTVVGDLTFVSDRLSYLWVAKHEENAEGNTEINDETTQVYIRSIHLV